MKIGNTIFQGERKNSKILEIILEKFWRNFGYCPREMSYSLRKGPTWSEKQILSYTYHIEECKIPFPTGTPAAL